jgi:hypothetical protein
LYAATISGGRFGGDGYGGGIYEFDLPAQFGGPASNTPTSQAPYGGQLIVLREFDHNNEGDTPEAQLGVGGDHHIYGTMSSSGPDGGGAIFGPLDVLVANNPPQTVLTYTGTDPVSHVTVRSPNPLEATSPNGALATLSSLGTADEDFDPLTFQWAQTAAPDFAFSTTTPALGVAMSTAIGTFPIGTSQVKLTADDGQPHVVSPFIPDLRTATINVVVKHTLPPVVTTSGNITVEAGPGGPAVATFTTSANDLVDGPEPTPTCMPASGSMFPLGLTSVTCSSADSAGKVGTATFTVLVQDTTPPAVTTSGNQSVEAVGPSGAVASFTASANDIVSGVLTPTCVPASGSTFAIGPTTVTCSATDGSGNVGKATLTITVKDTTPPVVTPGASQTIEATGPNGAVATFTASASDLVSGALTPTCVPASGSVGCGTGDRRRTQMEDAAGNVGKSTMTVTVRDTTPPTVTNTSVTAEATSASGAAVAFSVRATDLVTTSPAISCAPASGSVFPLGTTSAKCTATDAAGNQGFGTVTVTVQDTKPPVFSNVPGNITAMVAPTATGGTVSYTPPTAKDTVDGTTAVTCSPASGSTFSIGSTTVTCTSTDSHGNSANSTFTVTVVRDQAPVASNASATTNIGVAALVTLVATDADNQALTYQLATPPAHGTVTIVGNVATYTPATGYSGPDSFTFVANDGIVNSNPAMVSVTVLSHTTPVCSAAAASPSLLWPPNHKLVPIEIDGVTDADGSAVTLSVVSIFQDEPTYGLGDGDTPIDGFGVGTSTAIVRAERSGTGNGRVYHIKFTATANGLSCSGDVTVGVPHDMGNGRTPIDDGPQYDSTKSLDDRTGSG